MGAMGSNRMCGKSGPRFTASPRMDAATEGRKRKPFENLWGAVGETKSGQGAFFVKIILAVFTVVLGLMAANFFLNRSTMKSMAAKAVAASSSIAGENKKLLEDLKEVAKNLKDTADVQMDVIKKQRARK